VNGNERVQYITVELVIKFASYFVVY